MTRAVKKRAAVFCWLPMLLAMIASTAPAEEPLKSGLQVGDSLPSSFEPYNVTGEHAGKRHCLVCEYGLNPVVMIFARRPSEALNRLLVKLDAAVDEHRAASLGAFIVYLGDRDELEKQLAPPADKPKLKHVVISIDDPPGPEDYKVAKNAEVTVVLYTKATVKANHAFRQDQLTDKQTASILADLPLILPSK